MRIVVLDEFNIFNFYTIIKYLFIKSDIYYIKKKNSIFYQIYESLFFKKIKPLSWKFRQLKSDNSMNLYWHLLYYELEPILEEIVDKILKKTTFQNDKYIRLYLLRELSNIKLKPYTDKSILDIIYIVNSLSKIFKKENVKITYITSYFPWNDSVLTHLSKTDVYIKINNLNILYYSTYFIFYYFYEKLRNFKSYFKKNFTKISKNNLGRKIIIEHSLAINNTNYFMNNSNINKDNCILVNRISNVQKKDIIIAKKAGYKYLDLRKFNLKNLKITKIKSPYSKIFDNFFLNKIFKNYFYQKATWKYIFRKLNATTYLSSHFLDKNSIPTVAAINEIKGTSILYTSSYYERACPQYRFICDIYLSPASNTVNNLLDKFTYFKYLLPFGYTNSYKIDLLKKNSINIRKSLLKNNVKKIITFYDQGESKDDMFSMGHLSSIEGYDFLINKLLENKWLGLIIKPKKPGLLKNKLSQINNLVNAGLKTNRLILISESSGNSVKNFDHPPCESAMAADLAIHDTMVAGTAGIEAYLSNTKTIFFDRFNFFKSRFYQNKEKIVYQDWDELWGDAILFFKGKNKNFGTWDNEIIDQIDKFRDNNSDKRIAYITQKVYDFHNSKKNQDLEKIIIDYKKFWKIYDQ